MSSHEVVLIRLAPQKKAVQPPRTSSVWVGPVPPPTASYKVVDMKAGKWHVLQEYAGPTDHGIAACGKRIPGIRMARRHATVNIDASGLATVTPAAFSDRFCKRCFG